MPVHDGEIGFEITIETEQFTARGQSKVAAREEAAIKTLLNTTYCFTELPTELLNHSISSAQAESDLKSDINTQSNIESDTDNRSEIKSGNQSNIKSDDRSDIKSDNQLDVKSDAQTDSRANMEKVLDMFENDVKESFGEQESQAEDSQTDADNANLKISQTDNKLQSLINDKKLQNIEQVSVDDGNKQVQSSKQEGLFIPRSVQVESKDTSPAKKTSPVRKPNKDTSSVKESSPVETPIRDNKQSEQKEPAETNNAQNTQQV